MKLLSKTSLLIITVSIFIFMIGNVVFFYTLKHMINKHVNNELFFRMHKIKEEIEKKGINGNNVCFSNEITIERISSKKIIKPKTCDTVLYNSIQKKYIPYKSLKFVYTYQNKNYLITIYKSLLSSNKLIEKITVASIFMVITFLFMIYILNRFVFEKVWSNFFDNLKKVREYNINSRKKLTLETSEIDEFNKLNTVLTQMVEKIQKDFTNLKELTENTSHEIQTPLAIIKSKAELLLQSENISEKDADLIYSVLSTSERLSKLNKSLLMISKIENNQFEDNSIISVNEVAEKYIQNFKILFEAGNFKLFYKSSDLSIKINPVLLDVLISNLLKNAISHTEHGREISILITQTAFEISNSGTPLKISSDDIFKRFKKGTEDKERTGLGLEIVKKICDYYKIKIEYKYNNKKHTFSIDFSPLIYK